MQKGLDHYSYAGSDAIKHGYLGKKPKGNLIEGINKKLTHVRDSLPEGFTLEEFKAAFQKQYPAAYDAYEGDKGKRFDKWLENVIPSLPKKK